MGPEKSGLSNLRNETQAEGFARLLQEIKVDVTTEDRQEAVKTFTGISSQTISRYLNGGGKNNDVSAKLLKHFRECISERSKLLK